MTEKIKFEDWEKVDIRIAKIKSVEDHPNADKLLILKVDLGNEERQVVAGIKSYYKKEDLTGKKVAMITNLEPVKLRGIESDGMILAAVEDSSVVVLNPEKDIKEGAKVR